MFRQFIAAALAALLVVAPVTAAAQLTLAQPGGGQGFFGGSTYAPLGVTYFADVTIGGPLSTSPLNVTGSKTVLMSWWQKIVRAQPSNANTLTRSNPFDPIRTNGNVACETNKGVCLANDNTANKMQLNFYDSVGGGVSHGIDIAGVAGHTVQVDGQWDHFVVGYDLAAGTMAIYRNGVNVGPTGSGDFAYTNHNVTIDWSNTGNSPQGMGLVNSNQTDLAWGHEAELFVDTAASPVCTGAGAPSTMYGISVTCSGANTIPPEILAKFRDGLGHPVQRSSNCSDVTGSQPILCLYGDGAAFAVNHGTADSSTGTPANAFSVISILTGGAVAAPGYGPAGPPTGVAVNDQAQANNTQTVCGATPCTISIDASKVTGVLATGDFAIYAALLHDSTSFFTTGQTFACSSPGSTTWTKSEMFQVTGGAAHKEALIVCRGALAANDLGGVYSITWQSGALSTRDRTVGFVSYKNVLSEDVAASNVVSNPTSTSHCAGAVTTTAAGDTLVTLVGNFSASQTHQLTLPANSQMRIKVNGGAATPGGFFIYDENSVTSGGAVLAAGLQSARCATNATADTYEAITIALKHN